MEKIAIVTPGFLPVPAVNGGGVEKLIDYIISYNETNPFYEIDLLTIDSKLIDSYKYKFCNIIRVKKSSFSSIIYRILNKLCKFFKLDVNFNYYERSVVRFLRKRKYKYIVIENNMQIFEMLFNQTKFDNIIFHLHNDIKNDFAKTPELAYFILKKSLRVLVVSDYLRNELLKLVDDNYNQNTVLTIPNAIDLDIFNPLNVKEENKIYFLNKFGITNDDFVFLYTGRFSEEKGLNYLISAFNFLCKDYKNIKLLCVGSSDFSNHTISNYEMEIYNNSKNNNNIIFTGCLPQNELAVIYSISDCVCIPTIVEETFCLVALESLFMGKMVIGTRSGGMTELINGKGIVIEKDDIENNLRKEMLNLIENNKGKKNFYDLSDYKRKFDKNNYGANFFDILSKL